MTNTQDDTSQPDADAAHEWDNEGGALHHNPPPLPADLPKGITARWTLEYRVGPYRYLRFEEAKAEQQRRNRLADKPAPK